MFDLEISWIKDKEIREGVQKILSSVPEYFIHVPASSTGKYHPSYALGEGGLYRHVRAALKIAYQLFTIRIDFLDQDKDIILASLILHDCWKQGSGENKIPNVEGSFTVHEHPFLAAEIVRLSRIKFSSEIAKAIESHMGQWTTNRYSPMTLPKPKTEIQKFVHLCDYLAAQKFLEVKL